MKKGYSYVQLLVYCALFLILFAVVLWAFSALWQKTGQQIQAFKTQKQIAEVLDTIAEDVSLAETATISGNKIIYITAGTTYGYFLLKNRIVRQKSGYVYLTPQNMVITAFLPRKINNNLFALTIKTAQLSLERYIRRRN